MKIKMGNVKQGKLSIIIFRVILKINIYTKDEVKNVGQSFIAVVECANAYNFNNDINVPYKVGCELERELNVLFG